MCMYVTLAMPVSTGIRDIPLYISHVIYIYKINIILSLHIYSLYLSLWFSLFNSLTLYPNIDAFFPVTSLSLHLHLYSMRSNVQFQVSIVNLAYDIPRQIAGVHQLSRRTLRNIV